MLRDSDSRIRDNTNTSRFSEAWDVEEMFGWLFADEEFVRANTKQHAKQHEHNAPPLLKTYKLSSSPCLGVLLS